MITPWKKVGSKPIGDFRIFKLRSDICINPRTNKEHDFYVLETVGWVNVIALTPARELVMVQQFRIGSQTVELEIPGGIMDPGETDPVATGVRELREETGFEGAGARPLGWVFANPAIMNNRSHFIIVEQCVHRHACEFDGSEDLLTRLVPYREIPALVRTGKIRHPLVVAALHHYDLVRRATGG